MSEMVYYPAIWDYNAQPKTEEIDCCNLCGAHSFPDTEDQDRYGYHLSSTECDTCGLVFLNPRMTAAAYREFYESGAYRRLVSAYHGREINAETLVPEQREYGKRLSALLGPWWKSDYRTLLDVGGSTGEVARQVCVGHGCMVTVLDPAVDELGTSWADGVIRGTIEEASIPAGRTWDVVTLCQTVDHLLDPMAALRKIHDVLTPGGLFWVDALDYDRTRTIKIDHPFNFTERTMRAYLDKVGFAVLQTVRDGDHVGFVCRKAA